MSTQATIAAIIGLLLVGGGVYTATIFLTDQETEPSSSGQSNTQNEQDHSIDSLVDIFMSGKDLVCDVADTQDRSAVDGTVYIADGGERLRVDFESSGQAQERQAGSVIRTGGKQYVWGSFAEQGIVMDVTEENRVTIFTDEMGPTIDEYASVTCDTWRVDDSLFDIPRDIEFVSMEDVMMQFAPQIEADVRTDVSVPTTQDPCDVCNALPTEDARNQCLAAVTCLAR